jgi:hypothetical protein
VKRNLISLASAAREIGISVPTLKKYSGQGLLEMERCAGRWVIQRPEWDRFKADNAGVQVKTKNHGLPRLQQRR